MKQADLELLKERTLSYDCEGIDPPSEGDYLVSICRGRKPGTVYQILSARKVDGKFPARYSLRVFKVPELIAKTSIDFRFAVTVDGAPAYPLFWYSRDKTFSVSTVFDNDR